MTAKPFKPFRIHMASGKAYDITNHDGAMVARHSVEVGINPDRDGVVERIVGCAITHITRIEELQPA